MFRFPRSKKQKMQRDVSSLHPIMRLHGIMIAYSRQALAALVRGLFRQNAMEISVVTPDGVCPYGKTKPPQFPNELTLSTERRIGRI